MVEDKRFHPADNDDLPPKTAEQPQFLADDRQPQPAANYLLDDDGWPSLDSRCDKLY
ncbi:MAG: hypothetical protein IJB67_06180 [Firmicutes bacterium]|nr:hypothetical protein [Bacillota bacterium]